MCSNYRIVYKSFGRFVFASLIIKHQPELKLTPVMLISIILFTSSPFEPTIPFPYLKKV